MDLINGKTIYCPECGRPLAEYDGKVNGKTAHVTACCKVCDKHYHWVAAERNRRVHIVTMFSHYLKVR